MGQRRSRRRQQVWLRLRRRGRLRGKVVFGVDGEITGSTTRATVDGVRVVDPVTSTPARVSAMP